MSPVAVTGKGLGLKKLGLDIEGGMYNILLEAFGNTRLQKLAQTNGYCEVFLTVCGLGYIKVVR